LQECLAYKVTRASREENTDPVDLPSLLRLSQRNSCQKDSCEKPDQKFIRHIFLP
jgi:hypothetical protein